MKEEPNKALETMLEQGFAHLREGQFEEAVDIFTTCLAVAPRDDRAYRGRGLAHLQLKSPALAESDFTAARNLNNQEPENWLGLGLSLAVQNKVYEAIKVYEDLLAWNPTHVLGHVQLGLLQFKIGAISNGKDYFKKALTLRPNLQQRRMIEATLTEQDKLDKGRYYRPDFDRLSETEIEMIEPGKQSMGLGRQLLIWAGSVALIGTALFFYFDVPLFPLAVGSFFALAMTLLRHFRRR